MAQNSSIESILTKLPNNSIAFFCLHIPYPDITRDKIPKHLRPWVRCLDLEINNCWSDSTDLGVYTLLRNLKLNNMPEDFFIHCMWVLTGTERLAFPYIEEGDYYAVEVPSKRDAYKIFRKYLPN